MKKVGWSVVVLLVLFTYAPGLSSLTLWSWELGGIPLQAFLWLAAPVLAIGAIALIIPAEVAKEG